MKEEKNNSYDKLSKVYDFLSKPSEKKFKTAGLELMNPCPGEKILEIGCGTGTILLPIARSVGKEGSVTGIDTSRGMLDVCRKKLDKTEDHPGNIELQEQDARKLPFRSGSFHAVFCSFTLELFSPEDMDLVLEQVKKVLKKTGRFVIVCLSTRGKKGPLYPMYQWSHKKFPQWVDCRPINARAVLKRNGFSVEQGVSMSMWGLPVDVILSRKSEN